MTRPEHLSYIFESEVISGMSPNGIKN